MDLTPSQLEAVETGALGQDTCVVAGPGSGKTRVLVEWYQRLVTECRIPPSRILAITFTEKAANNMKARLARALAGNPSLRRELERACVSTVHGFCARFLRENAIFAGIDPRFEVLDARQEAALQAASAREALDELYTGDPAAARALIQAIAIPDLAATLPELYDSIRLAGESVEQVDRYPPLEGSVTFAELQAAIRRLRAEPRGALALNKRALLDEALESADGILGLSAEPPSRAHFEAVLSFKCNLNNFRGSTPIECRLREIRKKLTEAAIRTLLERYYAAERRTLLAALRRFDEIYRARKQAAGMLDFDDLEEATLRLLERNEPVRTRLREQFQQVLMDEFQDTNGLQSKLLDLVRAPNVFYAVGDINQSIYGFRHADPEVFHGYRDEVRAKNHRVSELQENWRSRADILRATETILHAAEGIEQRNLIATRVLPPKEQPSVEVIAVLGSDIEAAQDVEARWIARRILELEGSLAVGEQSRPAEFRDIAVLARNSEVFSGLTRAFEDSGIPYLINRGRGFFEGREVVDLVHLLRVISNTRDEISMAAVLRSPLVGVSDEALLRLKQIGNLGAAIRKLPFETGLAFDPEDLARLKRFGEQLNRWRGWRDSMRFDRLLLTAMAEAGYEWMPGTREGANIEKLLAIARETAGRLTFAAFVEELEEFRGSDARDFDPPPEDSANAVRIMTVHAAKGLEFPVVFLASLHKGVDPSAPSLGFAPGIGLGARWYNPATGKSKGDMRQCLIRERKTRQEKAESNRLLYVAMTRAEEHLVFSFACAGKLRNWAADVAGAFEVDCKAADNKWRTGMIGTFPVAVLCADQAPEPRTASGRPRAQVRILPRPSLTEGHDSNAAVTAVAQFAHCPRRYYLERYVGWDGAASRGGSSLETGLQAHALLARAAVEAHPEARRLAAAFETSPLAKRAARASRRQREFDFLLALEDIVLSGQIDLWFEENGELVLVDYKTDDVDAAETDSKAHAYGLQLRLYALALEQIAGRLPDKAFVYFLRPNIAAPVDLHPLFLHEAQQTVRDFREAQEKQEFPLNVGEHCRRCPFFRELCPATGFAAQTIGC